MTPWAPIWMIIAVALSLVDVRSSEWKPSAPDSVTVRLDCEFWAWGKVEERSTYLHRVAVGDTIGSHRLGWGWVIGAPPFHITHIESPTRIWVRCHGVVPASLRHQRLGDSILVTTMPRSFFTPSYDAGETFTLRVVDTSASPLSESLQYHIMASRRYGVDELERAVWNCKFAALGKVIRMRVADVSRGSLEALLTLVVVDPWGGGARTGDTLLVREGAMETDTTVRVLYYSTPIFRNDLVIGFFKEDRENPRGPLRMPWCALLAQKERLVFGAQVFGRGIPLERCKQMVQEAAEERRNPYSSRLVGMLIRGHDLQPISGAIVRDVESKTADTCDVSGWFDLHGLAPGHRRIQVRATGLPTSEAIIPLSDESLDTLLVSISPD